jgi:aerobic-type carbon monoxide dehydrogenase small subunit (CoxS/CutS family)
MAQKPVTFTLNGSPRAAFAEDGQNLLDFLRRGLGDLSPKYGCGQGTCGACTVTIDGATQLACLVLAEAVEGRDVRTAAGLARGPKLDPLQEAFMEHFAAQCGYCTPGMLVSAKGAARPQSAAEPRGGGRGDLGQSLPLHRLRADHRRDPRGRRGEGQRVNEMTKPGMIEFRKDLFADERDDNLNEVGKPTRRQDILGHVTGRSPFFDDHLFDGLLHLRCVRSPHHAARVRRIDTAEAERMPGVVRVLLGRDVPLNLNTLLSLLDFGIDDEPILSTDRVRYRGEPVAAVIAATEAQARAAVAAVRVEWEPLPHVLDVEEALKPGAPVVLDIYPTNKFVYHGKYDHQKLRYGDVEAAFRGADHIVEGRYQMSPIEQAPIETCGAIAAPEQNGRYVCYTSTQALFFSLGTAAKVLKVPSSRLHFIGGTVGGGFGGKVDSVHEPLAILGAMLTGGR